MREALCAQLEAISLGVGVDHTVVPRMPLYLEQLTRPWEPEEPPYEEEKDDDDEEADE